MNVDKASVIKAVEIVNGEEFSRDWYAALNPNG